MTLLQLHNVLYQARALRRSADFTGSESILQEALRRLGPSAPLFNELGALYAQQQKFRLALREFQQAVQVDPTFEEASLNVILLLCDLGRYGEAQEAAVQFVAKKEELRAAEFSADVPFMERENSL